jgi:hypothetical protein
MKRAKHFVCYTVCLLAAPVSVIPSVSLCGVLAAAYPEMTAPASVLAPPVIVSPGSTNEPGVMLGTLMPMLQWETAPVP